MYESFYGFTTKPFQLTPSANCFYSGKLHKKALAYLQYGLSQGEGFIVITGDVGTGKTTIANQLLAQLSPDEIIARQIVTSKLGPDDLIRTIAHSFNLVVNDNSKASFLDAIQIYLKRLSSQHRRALLLVDEAQNLPLESIEELRMLSNFQQHGKPLIQSFLLGQNELNAIIQAPNMEQFRQRIIASSNLKPLDEAETAEYVQFRLTQAGKNEPMLSPDVYPVIHRFSHGIPRKINLLMDRVLLLGFLEQQQFLNAEHVQKVVEEISGEVAHLTTAVAPPVASVPPSPSANERATDTQQNVQRVLTETLEQKIKLLKELDELILNSHKNKDA